MIYICTYHDRKLRRNYRQDDPRRSNGNRLKDERILSMDNVKKIQSIEDQFLGANKNQGSNQCMIVGL